MFLGFARGDARTGLNLIAMDLADRHLGSLLGLGWAILQPLLTVAVYAFVFGVLFQARAPGDTGGVPYVVWLLSGMGPWLAVSEGMMMGANSIIRHSALVKNVPMKTELLPIAGALSGSVSLLVVLVVVILALLFQGKAPSWTWLYLAPAFILQFALLAGLGLILAPIAVFVRDLVQALPSLLLVVMFMTPIVYGIEVLPSVLRGIAQLNPFYILIESYRLPLIYNQLPPWWYFPYLLSVAAAMLVVGLTVFRRAKMYLDSGL
jgi:lipopolysaccharide transport system permease protein